MIFVLAVYRAKRYQQIVEMCEILDRIQAEYNVLCQRLRPSDGGYSFLTEPEHNGAPHVEIDDGVFYYIVTERGLELEREIFTSKHDLLYRLVSDAAFWMSVAYEFENRIEGQDTRRVIFERWADLMLRVREDWAERTRELISDILARNPFMDSV